MTRNHVKQNSSCKTRQDLQNWTENDIKSRAVNDESRNLYC